MFHHETIWLSERKLFVLSVHQMISEKIMMVMVNQHKTKFVSYKFSEICHARLISLGQARIQDIFGKDVVWRFPNNTSIDRVEISKSHHEHDDPKKSDKKKFVWCKFFEICHDWSWRWWLLLTRLGVRREQIISFSMTKWFHDETFSSWKFLYGHDHTKNLTKKFVAWQNLFCSATKLFLLYAILYHTNLKLYAMMDMSKTTSSVPLKD